MVNDSICDIAVLGPKDPIRTFISRCFPSLGSLAVIGTMSSMFAQSALEKGPAVTISAPPGIALTVSTNAAKKQSYAAAVTGLRSGQTPPQSMVELAVTFARDPDFEVRSLAVGALLSVEPFVTRTEKTNWAALCGKMFRPMLDEIGMEPRPGEPTNVPQFRASLLGALGVGAADPAVIVHFRRLASAHLAETNRAWRPEMYAPIYISTLHGDAAWAKTIQGAFESAHSPDLRSRLLHLLIGFRDPTLVRAGLDYALKHVVEKREFMTLLLSGVLKESAATRFEWLKENFDAVKERLDPKVMDLVCIEMITAGDSKLFADGEAYLLDPVRRTPDLERIIEARKKELAPLFAGREKHRESLSRAIAKGLETKF